MIIFLLDFNCESSSFVQCQSRISSTSQWIIHANILDADWIRNSRKLQAKWFEQQQQQQNKKKKKKTTNQRRINSDSMFDVSSIFVGIGTAFPLQCWKRKKPIEKYEIHVFIKKRTKVRASNNRHTRKKPLRFSSFEFICFFFFALSLHSFSSFGFFLSKIWYFFLYVKKSVHMCERGRISSHAISMHASDCMLYLCCSHIASNFLNSVAQQNTEHRNAPIANTCTHTLTKNS